MGFQMKTIMNTGGRRTKEMLDMILSEARGIKETLGEIKLSTNSNIPHPSRDSYVSSVVHVTLCLSAPL